VAALLLTWPAAAEAQRGRGQPTPNDLTVFAGVSLATPESNDPDRSPILGRPGFGFVPGPFLKFASLDGSAEFGVRYSRRLADRLSFGGDFSIAPTHELIETTGFGCPPARFCIADLEPEIFAPEIERKARVVAYHYGGNVGIDLTEGTLRPEVIAGVGGVTYDVDRRRHTEFALRVGAALVAETGRLTTRLELLDVITPDHFVTGQAEHDVHVRVGLGVRW
jgi:hypothetical protein